MFLLDKMKLTFGGLLSIMSTPLTL